MDIYKFLKDLEISYERYDHPAVFTCEQAEELVPPGPGADTKNLFLRDNKGRRHFLVVVSQDTKVDLKALSKTLETSKLGFASPERLMKYLKLEPGSVSILALVNDVERAVEVIIDANLWKAEALRCHPLINTSTLVVSRSDIERILNETGHSYRVIDLATY